MRPLTAPELGRLVQHLGLLTAPDPTAAQERAGTGRLMDDLKAMAPAGDAAGADRTAPTT